MGITLVLTAVTALLGVTPGAATATPLAAPPVPTLAWGPCADPGDGFECATAQVPLDYRQPTGRTIPLAVTRHLAADPAHRTGVLLLHPGGPGNSGVDFARGSYDALPAALRDGFDVIGYDMRGVKRSGQVECWNDQEYAAAVDAAHGVPGPGALQLAVQQGRDFGNACKERSGDLVPFIGTASNAKDIDLLRQALGEEQLTFYGRSFGSYVGTVYAAQFPQRVRAMVLDGSYDPRHYADVPYAYDAGQFLALDAAVGRFLDWCAQTPTTCGFGDGKPRQAFEQLKKDLDARPVITASGRPATGYTLAYRLMFNINSGKEIWPDLGQSLRAAQEHRTTWLLNPPSPASFDFLNVNMAVECADRVYPTSRLLLGAVVSAEAAAAPLMGPPSAWGRPPTTTTTRPPAPSGRRSARAASRAPTGPRAPRRSWSSATPATRTPRTRTPWPSPGRWTTDGC